MEVFGTKIERGGEKHERREPFSDPSELKEEKKGREEKGHGRPSGNSHQPWSNMLISLFGTKMTGNQHTDSTKNLAKLPSNSITVKETRARLHIMQG